jgi:hypothetical protein
VSNDDGDLFRGTPFPKSISNCRPPNCETVYDEIISDRFCKRLEIVGKISFLLKKT